MPKTQAFLTFSSILNTPFGALTNRRLKALPKQRRSRVLRRVRFVSEAMVILRYQALYINLYPARISVWFSMRSAGRRSMIAI